ncbi:hypothetical protein IEQ34_010736 [Dendrobium chrysotoxum]|uniref:Uncharacterized protein n=1 Tax=Dendrobium chrysotoxum TaxID=161865 RepID=A0AAV7GWH6_DENCH|nr:hypothetical protein IEQ34_010736 [Dendrobium chrysotoxum]
MGIEIAELNESQSELWNGLQGLKQDLRDWKSKLGTQVKTYKKELIEFKKRQDDISDSLRNVGTHLQLSLPSRLAKEILKSSQAAILLSSRIAARARYLKKRSSKLFARYCHSKKKKAPILRDSSIKREEKPKGHLLQTSL